MEESSACLVRSFSAGTSSEPKVGDLRRALTTSISFGRFASDSLDWEKWSCFSNNRYLEEAEKFSKPGSVAEKKAYFEAHYKRKAAIKAAALLEQQNAANNECDLAEPESDSHAVIDEAVGNEAPNADIVCSVDDNVGNPNVEEIRLETDEVEEAERSGEQLVIEENSMRVELCNQHENVEKQSMIMSPQQEKKMPIMGAANQGNLVSTSKKKQSTSSSKPFTNIRASKLRSSIKMSHVQPSTEDDATQTSKKTARELLEKKRSTPKSLHMSINFSSHASEANKTSPLINKIGNSKMIRTFAKASRDSSAPLRIPTTASVNGLSVHPSETRQPERIRSKPPVDCKGSGRRTADGKSQSPSTDRSKPSGASGHQARPPIVASSFSLRCEERAAKRKEFFQKLEEKLNAEAEKVHLQSKSKEKAENLLKMRQSISYKTKPIANSHRDTASPSNHMKTIPLTRPRSPKLGRKLFPSTVHDTGSLPPWRSSVKNDGSKHAIEKSIRTSFHSINSLLRTNTHENYSPNIQ